MDCYRDLLQKPGGFTAASSPCLSINAHGLDLDDELCEENKENAPQKKVGSRYYDTDR